MTKVAENEFLVDASITTNDVERLINQELSIRDIQSIGAFLMEHLGHLPSKGETVAVPGALFTIEKIDGHVVETVRVKKVPVPQETE